MKVEVAQAVARVIVTDMCELVKGLEVTLDRDGAVALEVVEDNLRRMSRRWMGLMLGAVAEAIRERVEADVRCRCGERGRNKGGRQRQQETMVGPLRYWRSYYYCQRCGKGWYPLDEAMEVLRGQFSAKLVEAMSYLGAGHPFRMAVELMERLVGVTVSASSVERGTKARGAVLEARSREVEARLLSGKEAAVAPPKAGRVKKHTWVVQLDAAKALFQDGWREVKVGVVCLADSREALGVELPSYISRVRDMEGAGQRLYAEAVKRGVRPERDTVVCLADGAPANWSQFELHFPHRVEVLDWYHAVEHLWAAGRAGLGEGNENTKTWVEEQEALLWQGDVPVLIAALETLSQRTGSEAVAREARYFQANRERIRYDRFRRCGYPIGSGHVESACKQLVTARLKGPGMRWSDQGAQSVLTLRCAMLGRQWDQAWSLTKAA